MITVKFALSFEGNEADGHQLDFYDAAFALAGFQRTLALTTHLILNGKIITQAPALKGARILINPPEAGSWKIVTIVGLIASGAYTLGTLPKDTVLGHFVTSAYDYVIKETLGVHVDFDKTLGQQYEELKKQEQLITPEIVQSQMDSLIEKCEDSVKHVHRPIYVSKTAQIANIENIYAEKSENLIQLNSETFNYVNFTSKIEHPIENTGRVSSYNINTYKGRIFIPDEGRPIPFELAESIRDSLMYTGDHTKPYYECQRQVYPRW